MYQCRQCFKENIPEDSINIYCKECLEERKRFRENINKRVDKALENDDACDMLKDIF
jgi:uncharacterized Zn ribbon protein